jgi:hypothetical protein
MRAHDAKTSAHTVRIENGWTTTAVDRLSSVTSAGTAGLGKRLERA